MYRPLPAPLRRSIVLLAAPIAFGLAGAHAAEPAPALAQLHHDKWTSRDGMPGDVWEMTQDRDGWMWFATTSGLYRFDGVRFEHVQELGGVTLLSNVVATVRAFDDGSLWIGYRFAGLGIYKDGILRHVGQDDGYGGGMAYAIVRDGRGRTWSGTNKGLYMLDGGRWQRIGAAWGLPEDAGRVMIDPYDRLWVRSGTRLYYLDPGATRFAPSDVAARENTIVADARGQLWAASLQSIQRLPARWNGPGRPRRQAALPFSTDTMFDRGGNLWTTSCDGVCRFRPSDLDGKERLSLANDARESLAGGLSSPTAMSALEDREGNLWVATRSGVDRLREDRVVSLGLPAGTSYITMALDGAGTLWLTGDRMQVGSLWRHDAGGLHAQPDVGVSAVAAGRDGALLVARRGAIERRHADGRRSAIPVPAGLPKAALEGGARAMLDTGDALWATFSVDRTYRHAGGGWHPATASGLPDAPAVCMDTATDGATWFGYLDNRVYVLRSGTARGYGSAQGLDVGVVGALAEADGMRVVGGDKGVAVLAGERFVGVRAADPQLLAGVSGILRDGRGDMWFNGRRGLVRVPRAAWRAAVAAPSAPIADYQLFDGVDGYPGIARMQYGQSSLVQGRDGRLWISSTGGAALLDPQRLARNPAVPPIHILALREGGRRHGAGAVPELPAGTRDLQIDYTAPSFRMPERVRFRYRLDGVDGGWQDAGARRTAYYSNLGPGSYRFRVGAANEDGVWTARDATLDFEIAPTFVQGTAFKLLCAAALAAGAWLLVRLRLRAATRRLRRLLRERAGERERIARTLHDTLMQSVQALLMLFETARDRLPPDNPSRPLLDRTLEQARRTLGEGRDELYALRGARAAAHDLAAALAPLGHMLGEQYGVGFDIVVEGQQRTLRADVAQEACFIAREALQNAFRHAKATQVLLRLRYDEAEFVLEVRDDGRGLGPGPVRPGHWGLAGMRERAAAIGARIAIGAASADAGDGGGTLVALRLEARLAYPAPPRRRLLPGLSLFRGVR
jgi:signal transduction histidine kinase/ligand-binding sensor domain-containing protein